MTLDGDIFHKVASVNVSAASFFESSSQTSSFQISEPPPTPPVEPASNHWRPLEKK